MDKLYLKKILVLYEKGELSKQAVHELINHQNMLPNSHAQSLSDSYAIVGLSCNMPDANNRHEFMHNLYHAKNCIREFPQSRRHDIDPLLAQLHPDSLIAGKKYWRGGFLDQVAYFDNDFFNILPAEARIMDPQIRLFMQTAYHAFEDAGYTRKRLAKYQTGVFISDVNNEYRDIIKDVNASSVVGNISPFIGARVARFYDFHGPVVNISTTCSSSLVTMHYALLSLSHGECDIALVGASNLRLFPFNLKDDPVAALGILSPDEKCRTFDDHANGIVRGEGIVAFVVKRMQDAVRDKDYIYATMVTSLVNNDGLSSSVGAPNPVTQQRLLVNAWKKAGIYPGDIQYLEAHGTGTKIGDPIEIQAITNAFREFTQARQFCGIGSVKTNIGHLTGGGAGLAGLFKVANGLDRRKIPSSLHFTTPNTLIDFTNSPLFVVDNTLAFSQQSPVLAGVSAFGFNGTNCHILLKSYEKNHAQPAAGSALPFVFSARQPSALKALLISHLKAIEAGRYDDYSLGCISYTLLTGRECFNHRICLLAKSLKDLETNIRRMITNWEKYDMQQGEMRIFIDDENTCSSSMKNEAETWLHHDVTPETWLQSDNMHIVPLALYPFQGKHYWPETPVLKNFPTKTSDSVAAVSAVMSKTVKDHIHDIWEELLGIEAIQDNVSFFSLGGDSLLAVQLISMIKARLEKDITYEEFAYHNTIAQLTELVNSHATTSIPKITPATSHTAALSHAQYRMWFMRYNQPHGNAYNMPQLFTVKSELDLSALQSSIRAIINKYEILRTRFIVQEGQPIQKIEPYQDDFTINIVDLTEVESGKAALLNQCHILTQQAFALDKLYLFSCSVFKLNPDEYTIFFVIDHMICDGWSLHILMQEIFENYLSKSRLNETTALTDNLEIQFKDYAVWEQEYLKSDHAKCSESFWHNKLQNYGNNSEIKGDLIRPATFDYQGKDFLYAIDSETYSEIQAFLKNRQVTLYELLLSSVFLLTHLYSNENDIILGSVSSGRILKELDTQIGCFTNILPVRQYIDEAYSFNLLINEVKLYLQQALEFQNYPFDKMVESLKIPRDFSRHPLFSIHVSLQDYKYLERMHDKLKALNIEHIYLPNDSAKWDLQFEFTDKGGYLEARLEYASSIYSSEFAQEISHHHSRILKALMSQSNETLSALKKDFNPKKQSNKLAFAWN